MKNIFQSVPEKLTAEVVEDLINAQDVRVERIISKGHTSPEKGWYDQAENEWVIVLQGAGELEFEDGRKLKLEPGDYLNIPKHQKHKVSWTVPNAETIWLAIFYR
ncbi:MAG: cupin domain-containing protein [Kangiellaceae bacterium]|nr:cupin domain-containing protein [Kangiellaceae bacterium]MCW8997870.1 cupin domain-containing protein [Kangiellaceae bacterium]MCW9017020.1 cupin domain-containing protein [Kangiellaceae bacterium]